MENKLQGNENPTPNYNKRDRSDRKATDMLIDALFPKNVSPLKRKQSSLDTFCCLNSQESNIPKNTKKSTPLKRHRYPKKLSNVTSPKLTKWLHTVNLKHNADSRNDDNKFDNPMNKADKSPKKMASKEHATYIRAPDNSKQKLLSSQLSSSYKQYGITIPSFEEILEERRANEEYKKCLSSIKDLELLQLPDISHLGQVDDPNNYYDCKHLSLTQIEQAFKNNIDYISRVRNRQFESKPHREIMYANLENILKGNMSCIVSMVVFTRDQKRVLSSLLYKNFGDDDNYFKALMPELCMKIFMDVFDMSYEEAYDYLRSRPVEM